MERWQRDLDRYLTTPPEDEPKYADSCELCDADIFEGDEIYICENSNAKLCSAECAKEWLMEDWQEHFVITEQDPVEEYTREDYEADHYDPFDR